MKKILVLVGIFFVALIVGTAVLFQKKKTSYHLSQSEKQDQGVQAQQVEDAKDSEEAANIISASKTYRNEDYDFEFQYSGSFVLDEVNSEVDFSKEHGTPDGSVTTFRYVLLKSLEDDFTVSIGVKNKDDGDSVSIRQWRTGVAAGDFRKSKRVRFGDGIAEQMELSYQGEINGLVWFCGTGTVSGDCSDIDLKNGKKAYVEINFDGEENPQSARWRRIEKEVHEIIESFHTF